VFRHPREVAIERDVLSERLFEDAVVFFREAEGVAQNRIGIGSSHVVHELERHIGIPSDRIKVTVKNGWVTLEGSIGVEWQYQKILAESAVKKLRGVTGITNDIEVKPQVSPQEARSQIEEALRRSAALDAVVTWSHEGRK
jgi:osmotically-inducible protein OsmY